MKLTKQLHEITLKDVILLDSTKSPKHLKRFWFIPIRLMKPQLESLAQQMFDAIGGSTVESIENEMAKVISINSIQILEALYKATRIELDLKTRINVWKLILDKDYKESEQLKLVLEKVLDFTGIEIKTPENLKQFEDFIEFKVDKHRENYPEIKPDETKQVKLSRIIYSVFNFMNEPYNEAMRLITFIELKDMAEDKIRQQIKQQQHG